MKERYLREAQIAYLLRAHLARAKLTQRKWARKYGIPEQIVSDFLNGRRGPSEDILEALGFNPEPAWSEAMSRKPNVVPVPEHVQPSAESNRKQIAALRQEKKRPKRLN